MTLPGELTSRRAFRTGYLPTYSAALFLLTLAWGGAPGHPVDFGRAWRTADHLGVMQVLLLALAVTLAAVLLQPLQLSLVRMLEGGFPVWLGSGLACAAQVRRKKELERSVTKKLDAAVALIGATASHQATDKLVQEAGTASAKLRSRFPLRDHAIRATALGNALAAAEETAGSGYGLDAVVIWPRLYPLLSEQVRAAVDDLRDGMDAAARLTATGVLTALAATGLLAWHSGLRTLLALLPLTIAVLSYLGAVRAATAFGIAMSVAFDLHRFDLLRTLKLAMPATQEEEQETNRALSDFLRQGVPAPFRYTDAGSDARQ